MEQQSSKFVSWLFIIAGHILCASLFGMLWNQSLALIGLPILSWWKSICLWTILNLSIIVPFIVCYGIHKGIQDISTQEKK